MLTIVSALLVAAIFIKTIVDESSVEYQKSSIYFGSSIEFVTLISIVALTVYEYNKSIVSSATLFLFWLVNGILSAIRIRTNVHLIKRTSNFLSSEINGDGGGGGDVYDNAHAILTILSSSLSITNLFLHCFAEKFSGKGTSKSKSTRFKEEEEEENEMKPLLHEFKVGTPREGLDPCPEPNVSFPNKITFFWFNRLLWKGFWKALTASDLFELRHQDSCSAVVPPVVKEWNEQVKNIHDNDKNKSPSSTNEKRPNFAFTLFKVFGLQFGLTGLLRLANELLTIAQPQLLNLLITFISVADPFVWHGYFYVLSLFAITSLRTILFQNYWQGCYETGLHIRSAVIGMIYRKSLKLSNTARRETTTGEIVNLMAVDAQKLQDMPGFLHLLWASPLTAILAIYFLWQELGPSSLAGLAIILCLIPFNAVLASKQKKLQYIQMKWKDQRIKMINEVLSGIKVIKLYAWEKSFQEKINSIRQEEVRILRKSSYIDAITSVTWFCAPFLVALSSFGVFILSSPENILDANKAFVSLSLFNILNVPMTILPGSIVMAIQAYVSLLRVNRFLCEDEIDSSALSCDENDSHHAVNINDGTFCWTKGDEPTLKDIDLKIEEGSFIAIVGSVGAGKSSLINAILGEMVRLKGHVHVRGNVALVPQQAWCQNSTLQENILFGSLLDHNRYKKVISACALEPDIKILPGGDLTEIGEKGINLSGGQKQRISLARAVYQNCDVYLLDDPLSAVDSHVAKHLFDHVLSSKKGMLKDKTRILVTHSITFLPQVDSIVVLNNGRVTEVGSYQQLMENNQTFAEFIRTNKEEEQEEKKVYVDSLEETDLLKRSRRQSSLKGIQGEGDKSHQLIQEELSETGTVKLSIFISYLRSASFLMVFITTASFFLYMLSAMGANLWLNEWTELPVVNETQNLAERNFYLGIYGLFGLGQATFLVIENFALAFGAYCASSLIHSVILKNILKAPMSFFDTTPLGRIVNRFSKDIDTVDVNIPQTFRSWLSKVASFLSSLIVISIASPYFMLALVPLGFLYIGIQRFYLNTSRQLKRIDSVKRSPIYSHFQDTIVGAGSIRAYKRQEVFVKKSDLMVDDNQKAWYLNLVSFRWLGIYLESVGNLIILLAGTLAVWSRDGSAAAGLAALSVTYSLQITAGLNHMVRLGCDLETYIVAIERLHEYKNILLEASWQSTLEIPKNWPNKGEVEFRNYSVRYRSGLDLVLKDLNLTISSGEKVGVVGRTGAGKSSLTMALFRILEPASGSIFIDNIDITHLGLHELRNCLTIIPQDPVIFSGSLRMNLDPFEEHEDGELWTALDHAHLKSFVVNQTVGLQHQLSEGGDNLSVGQRQLLCLARALLRKTKILFLDEATAAVDLDTDSLIQQTIHQEFADCTVLTIAHRLNTIIDYDKVIVLDRGRILEYGKPNELLKKENSMFHIMARDAGLV